MRFIRLFSNTGKASTMLNDFATAVAHFRAAVEKNATVENLCLLAQALVHSGDMEGAVDALQTACSNEQVRQSYLRITYPPCIVRLYMCMMTICVLTKFLLYSFSFLPLLLLLSSLFSGPGGQVRNESLFTNG